MPPIDHHPPVTLFKSAIRNAESDVSTDLLIVDAGAVGLATAAQAEYLGIAHVIVGQPMEFLKRNIPKSVYLGSASDWHLDPLEVETIEKFTKLKGPTAAEVEPLSLEFSHDNPGFAQQRVMAG